MISQKLLTAKGSIEALISLTQDGSQVSASLADDMDVAEGTARARLNDLQDAGLVTEDAALRDDRPVRVFAASDEGEQLAMSLQSILDDYGAGTGGADTSDEATEDITESGESA